MELSDIFAAHPDVLATALSNATGNLDLNLSDYNLMLPYNLQIQLFSGNGIYADGPNFVWNDGGVQFGYGGNHIDSFTSSGVVDLTAALLYADASNLTNVPPPAGLFIDAPDSYIATGGLNFVGAPGSLVIGDGGIGDGTQLLSGPNTLGPLDGSALTIYGEPLINNGNGLYFDGGEPQIRQITVIRVLTTFFTRTDSAPIPPSPATERSRWVMET